ncbi:hypothetical protein SAMN05216534_0121 [Candidatus Aquiluna sp. UB-MaderosW2red]|nr:hypothetical protein SAMN05216534_0121 [Candidatus Aquiluna sp. UB-MaderosW2red]
MMVLRNVRLVKSLTPKESAMLFAPLNGTNGFSIKAKITRPEWNVPLSLFGIPSDAFGLSIPPLVFSGIGGHV